MFIRQWNTVAKHSNEPKIHYLTYFPISNCYKGTIFALIPTKHEGGFVTLTAQQICHQYKIKNKMTYMMQNFTLGLYSHYFQEPKMEEDQPKRWKIH